MIWRRPVSISPRVRNTVEARTTDSHDDAEEAGELLLGQSDVELGSRWVSTRSTRK